MGILGRGYAVTMTDDHVWRDEEKLPLSELNKAMATSDTDGQNDPEDLAEPEGDAKPSWAGPTGPN